ncbi:glycine dehydrogenase subunit 2 [Candidatus Omnitrophus magneticus]|uniref:glycine dehydrogenase (aminomethyl-transferring) n=1 Tax=Candidatus Omnitrophus magneticus TaxID=1609969 RepID=A0A0F0CQD3_9BACT|nr:glycine dehydrogenase subunit 2 [Candidatus Omnitrophus magneticus]
MELIFKKSKKDRRGTILPKCDVPPAQKINQKYLRTIESKLPNVSEPEVVRHFTNLAKLNFNVDENFYPLGSCTMKYNPKFLEKAATMKYFSDLHPLQPQIIKGGMLTQGALELIWNLENLLSEITGMDEFTTHPMAGAHGELTGVMLMAAYHKQKGNRRTHIIIPDSGHGTNPASAAIAGYEVKSVKTSAKGLLDIEELKKILNEETAGLMLTCPNTLGIFESQIKEISDLTHKAGGLMYYDGANLNAIMGKARPGDLGFDIVHLNLHKTFATPHGAGGPGSGPVGVKKYLTEFLPISRVVKRADGTFALDYDKPLSIGYISPFYGNYGVLIKAYTYILLMGKQGLIDASENAVINANYIKSKLKNYYDIPYPENCLHEFVISATKQAEKGVHAIDIAKALIDKGIHPPTVYFPLNVKEAIMIEPTETESKETLDEFINIMIELSLLAEKNPDIFKNFPKTTSVSRLDEVKAAKDMNLASLA